MTAESESADVFDFVDAYLLDLERGEDRPLAYWLERFPRSQEAIAREWISLRQSASGVGTIEAPPAGNGTDEAKNRVGPYRILRELGRGGQGTVFLAEDTRMARRVALKMLTSRFDSISDEKRQRFKREADVIAKLEHPGLCSIHDADLTSDSPWIAMRFIEGRTLGECIVEARERGGGEVLGLHLPPRTTLEVHAVLYFFERAARALHAAHEAGVVHRDVKPGNVIVAVDGRPVLLDFGLARDETSETGTLTQSGDVFGTPAYMSPEQLSLPSSELDRRTDVYSLGVALYEALTLERPFDNSAKSLLYRAIQSDPPPDPRKKNKTLSEDVKVVLETALEKDRARRYASTLEFAEDLRRIREYEPIRARPASVGVKFERWVRRHPALAVAIMGTIASLTIGLVVTLKLLANEHEALVGREQALAGKDEALEWALGKHLAQRAVALSLEDPPAAVVLGIEGVEKAPGELTRSNLFTALDACWLMTTIGDESLGLQIGNIASSPVGDRGAVAFNDGAIEVVSLTDGKRVVRVQSTEHAEAALVFDARGTRILAASEAGTLRIFDAASGAQIAENKLEGPFTCVRTAREGARLVVIGPRIGGVVLSAETLERTAELAAARDEYTQCAVSENGESIVTWRPGKSCAAFAPDGRRLFDVKSGGGVNDAAFSEGADTRRLLIAGVDGALHVLDGTEGRELGPTLRFPLAPTRIVACPDGRFVAVATNRGEDGAVYLCDIALGTSLALGEGLGRRVTQMAFSPDEKLLATTSHDLKVRVWHVTSGNLVRSFTGTRRPADVAWSADGERLITRPGGGSADLWIARARADLFELDGHARAVRSVAFARDGRSALTASDDGTARLWNVDPASGSRLGRETARMAHPGPLKSAQFSADGKLVLSVGTGVEARTWDAVDGRPLRAFAVHNSALTAAAIDPRGERFATLSVDGRTRIWPTRSDDLPIEVESDGTQGSSVAFSLDGRYVAVGGAKDAIRVVTAIDGRVLRTLTFERDDPEQGGVVALRFRPITGELAAACGDLRLRWFDVYDGRSLLEDTPNRFSSFSFRDLSFSADGSRVLVTSARGGGAVRSITLGTPVAQSPAVASPLSPKSSHTDDITSACYADDASIVLTTSKDGTVRAWHTQDGAPFVRREGFGSAILCSALSSASGEIRVITGSAEGRVFVWPLDPLPAARARRLPPLHKGKLGRETELARPLEYP